MNGCVKWILVGVYVRFNAQEQARRRIRMMSIVKIPMISNSPRRATLWATPVRKPKEVLAKIPMILCESEPGNTQNLQNQ